MTKEDKQLLIKDLCGRIPYNVKGSVNGVTCTMNSVANNGLISFSDLNSPNLYEVQEFKPYLFPLSSMTREDKEELYSEYCVRVNSDGDLSDNFTREEMIAYFDYVNRRHFDYRGLIKKNLGLDATGLNIYD